MPIAALGIGVVQQLNCPRIGGKMFTWFGFAHLTLHPIYASVGFTPGHHRVIAATLVGVQEGSVYMRVKVIPLAANSLMLGDL